MNETDVNVLIAVPTMRDMHVELVALLLYWQKKYKAFNPSFYFTDRVTPHDSARNQIVEYFFNAPVKFTHLLMIDSDTIPPYDALPKLLRHDVPVLSAMVSIVGYNSKEKKWEFYDNTYQDRETDANGVVTQTNIAIRDTGLQKIFRCGAACLLIKREVLEALKPPYFRFDMNEERTKHTRSEDIYFCDQVRDAGFDIYAETDVHCGHFKSIMI